MLTGLIGHHRFNITKLRHLTNPDWRKPEDRTGIAACLVDVAYLLEKTTDKEQANEWCSQLQFHIAETITDDHDGSIFAVVFQWQGQSKPSEDGPPSVVVAFRGTLLKLHTAFKDLFLDLKIFSGCLNSSSSRISKGVQTLERIINKHGSQNVWIAGHSLGASIALVAGKCLVKKGHKLEAHLFNPPFVSHWLRKHVQKIGKEKLCSKVPELKQLIVDLRDCNKSGQMVSDFIAVKDWMPNLYVNDKDRICRHYIRYFEEWKRLNDRVNEFSSGIQTFEEIMKEHSFGTYLLCFEAIPCAKLVEVHRRGIHRHHAIKQWHSNSKDLNIKTTEYIPPAETVVAIGQLRALPASAAYDEDTIEEDSEMLNLFGLQMPSDICETVV